MRYDSALLVVSVDIDLPLLSGARLSGWRAWRQRPPHQPPDDHLRMRRNRIEHHVFWRAAHAGELGADDIPEWVHVHARQVRAQWAWALAADTYRSDDATIV